MRRAVPRAPQACRQPYGLIVDGVLRDLGDYAYLLSPQDLSAIELIPQMLSAGVSCLKIEGRLKGPEYVAVTTALYRRAVDAAWAARGGCGGDGAFALSREERWELEQVFARGQDGEHRGLTPGFLNGPQHQRLVRGRAPRHRGVFVGAVKGVRGGTGRGGAGRAAAARRRRRVRRRAAGRGRAGRHGVRGAATRPQIRIPGPENVFPDG